MNLFIKKLKFKRIILKGSWESKNKLYIQEQIRTFIDTLNPKSTKKIYLINIKEITKLIVKE